MSARVAFAVTLVLALGVLALSLAAYWRVSASLAADLDRNLLREAEAFAGALAPGVAADADLRAATRTYLTARSQASATSRPVLLVHFASGTPAVISNSSLLLETATGNATALEVATAKSAFVDLSLGTETYRATTVPIRSSDGTVVAVFEAALPTSTVRALGTELLVTMLGIGLLVVALGALVAVWAARASLRPLARTASTAARITQSSLAERIDYNGPGDEVGLMVSAINEMLDRLESAFGEQRRFTADASHELRTPLAVVSGHVEMLRDLNMDPAERAEELALISDEVARMGRLVDDLLALARLESASPGSYQPLEVSSLLEEAAARGRGLGRRTITVDSPQGLWVSGNPDQLTQALLNLVGNAVAHTEDGGAIALAAEARGDQLHITVSDDGPGIRREDLPRVFDRFYRVQGPRGGSSGGSGLGLAITRRLIEMHGGTISAANRPLTGAVFAIDLRRIEEP
jgi:two-component system OmpR family sensor kinase